MSGGAVHRHAVRHLVRGGVNRPAVMKAIEAGQGGPLQIAYDLGVDAGLPRDILLDRAAAVFLMFACLNLTDDLQDGDAGDYLAAPASEGPAVQLLLQCESFALLAAAGVAPSDIAAIGHDVATAAAGQLEEIEDAAWTADRYLRVGESIAGLQYAVYATIMWSGTPLAPDARAVGRALGFAAHVAEDLRSEDRRLLSVPEADLDRVLSVARADVSMLMQHSAATARRASEWLAPRLRHSKVRREITPQG